MTMTRNGSAYTVTGTPVAFVPAAGINLGLGLSTQTRTNLIVLLGSLRTWGGAGADGNWSNPANSRRSSLTR